MNTQRDNSVWLNKVPEITLVFWLIKMMSTTVGETAADFLNMDLNFGLTWTSIITGVLLAIALFFQMRATRYSPIRYWVTVVFISVFGTLVTDNLTDAWHVPLAVSSLVFSVLLIITFAVWYRREGTLSIHSIDSRSREAYYWLAILATFALGTAVGDWLSEGIDLGYYGAALFFGVWIVIVAVACFTFKANRVFCFWAAYILTRPFGAACGDLLSQPADNGGIGLGANLTSLIFGLAIMAMIGGLVVHDWRKRVNAQ